MVSTDCGGVCMYVLCLLAANSSVSVVVPDRGRWKMMAGLAGVTTAQSYTLLVLVVVAATFH